MVITLLKYATIIAGLTSVGVSVFYGNEHTQWIKPVFHLFLFGFYWAATKKFNRLLALMFGAVMMGEYFAAATFEANFQWIVLLFVIFFVLGIWLLKPLLLKTEVRIKWVDMLVGVLVITGLFYIIAMVFVLSVNELKEFTALVIGTIAFCVFILSCFFLSAFNDHSKRIYLFVVGAGYTMVCLGTLIYELLYSQVVLLGIVNLCEVIAQFSFVYFMMFRDEKIPKKEWLI